ncbi:predicted protein [Thalassiosira pseudonana CCMP1335]|uniref:Sulfotransferase domain-containing protein n=1 Tax=Thalassiosira pseudonana TaxID=35128 RepID=B5YNY1_THAPS|nr:predicted protein [Thalassiosira pseudonana CCMP1335]ACI65064.1 predicted protein [Thalassiosira pseudonana CCMP1335]
MKTHKHHQLFTLCMILGLVYIVRDTKLTSTLSDVLRDDGGGGALIATNATTESKDALITCDRKVATLQTNTFRIERPLVTIPEFWDERNNCSHFMNKNVIFFHVGKAGGGTVKKTLGENKLSVSMSHPKPKIKYIDRLKHDQASLIINVRDPVDRFASAFHWRLLLLCSPNDTRRQPEEGDKAFESPREFCYNIKRQEKILREKYKSSPSVLGEALCDESGKQEEAAKEASKIGHSLQLVQWLDFLVEPELIAEVTENGIRDFMALPLEKQKGNDSPLFEQHLDQLSLALLEQRYGREVATRIIESTPQTVRASEQKKEKWEHSSVQFNNSTKPPPLTKLGECCLSRHLEKDYRLIQSMLGDVDEEGVLIEPLGNAHPVIGNACKWGSDEQQKLCRADLRSILTRRAVYLDHSEGTCSEVVSRMQ